MMMIQRILVLILAMVLITPAFAGEGQYMNDTLIPGENLKSAGNISPVCGIPGSPTYGLNESVTGNETRENQTIKAVYGSSPVGSPVSETIKNSTGVLSQTPGQVYKQSIGSVYEADYQEPEPMTFTFSGCGS